MTILMRLEMQKVCGHDYHDMPRMTVVINITVIIIVVIPISFYTFTFYTIHLKCGVREHLRCRGCVVMIINMTTGDAEDAS